MKCLRPIQTTMPLLFLVVIQFLSGLFRTKAQSSQPQSQSIQLLDMGEYIYNPVHSASPSILTPQFLRSLKSHPESGDFSASSFCTADRQPMDSTHTAVKNDGEGVASLSTAGLDQPSVSKIETEESPPVHRLRVYQVQAAVFGAVESSLWASSLPVPTPARC